MSSQVENECLRSENEHSWLRDELVQLHVKGLLMDDELMVLQDEITELESLKVMITEQLD
jgi:hypothetical protein